MKWRTTAVYFLVLLLIGRDISAAGHKKKGSGPGGKGIQARVRFRRWSG